MKARNGFAHLYSRLGRFAPRRRGLSVSDQTGAALLEAAIVLPVLVVLALGGIEFGYLINNYVTLTHATRAGGRQLALARPIGNPRAATVGLVQGAAVNLVAANLTITTTVNGVACASDAACQSALATARGQPATVTVQYPCVLLTQIVRIPNCILSATVTERVE
jgi:Flp pilus assembly protein TadG